LVIDCAAYFASRKHAVKSIPIPIGWGKVKGATERCNRGIVNENGHWPEVGLDGGQRWLQLAPVGHVDLLRHR
jgi:hypothetical protein